MYDEPSRAYDSWGATMLAPLEVREAAPLEVVGTIVWDYEVEMDPSVDVGSLKRKMRNLGRKMKKGLAPVARVLRRTAAATANLVMPGSGKVVNAALGGKAKTKTEQMVAVAKALRPALQPAAMVTRAPTAPVMRQRTPARALTRPASNVTKLMQGARASSPASQTPAMRTMSVTTPPAKPGGWTPLKIGGVAVGSVAAVGAAVYLLRKRSDGGIAGVIQGNTAPVLHRDGTVTYWSVYEQRWVRSGGVPDRELAVMNRAEREKVQRHMERHR